MLRRLVLLCLCILLTPSALRAQNVGGNDPAWAFYTRAVMTGVSDSSEPEGYKVYSALGMEAGLTRLLGHNLALGWTFGTESREVEFTGDEVGKVNLGSIEALPLTMLLQFRPHLGGRFHPYVGGGAQFTVFWEKSGALDSTDLTPEIGPVLQAGFDLDISPRMVFNVEFRAARLETDLEGEGQKIATISLHPSTLGVGIGFRF